MKLVSAQGTQEAAAAHVEAFAKRLRCGLVKRYVIVSIESSESDSRSNDPYVQHFRDVTTVIEDLAFIASVDLLKDSLKSELNCDEDDD